MLDSYLEGGEAMLDSYLEGGSSRLCPEAPVLVVALASRRDAASAAFTVTLPAAASVPAGRIFTVKKTDSSTNAVTVGVASTDHINGAATFALPRDTNPSPCIPIAHQTGGE
jgi:bifunctional ADP-heptose synthase (sugar kinase/adenylyltransferase)